jgi:hypothetical protein
MGVLKNEKGQMAIFIALFFQVLFVFFAMAINVGLVVHDKINLQNAVDLAAYYGAMKQGEVLNQIAHVNYQMRQNYKLFVYRYRALGTLGNTQHPLYFGNNQDFSTVETDSRTLIEPSVCIAHPFWAEALEADPDGGSLCLRNGQAVRPVQQVTSAAGFVPGSGNLAPTFQSLAETLTQQCREAGYINWLFAARILAHYRADGVARKNIIGLLAGNLTGPQPLDLRGESIEEGVRGTFERNLTDTNSAGIQNFQYFNSLSSGQCAEVQNWLAEIRISPIINFSDWNSSDGAGCPAAIPKPNSQGGGQDSLPFSFNDPRLGQTAAQTQTLQQHWAGEPPDEWHSSIGFEKNPWCMVYTGVTATTRVRKPFDPTGGGVTLQARGFAKPFGGRIGPWYGKTWPQGAFFSQAGNRNEMVDPLLPSRDMPGGGGGIDPAENIANYSRFPGDTVGFSAMSGLGAMSQAFQQGLPYQGRQSPSQLALRHYETLDGLERLQQTGDGLARDNGSQARQRPFELAATAPDPFDAFYYSIEPRYYNNYFTPITTNSGASINQAEQIYDIGSSKDGAQNSTQDFSVLQQIEDVPNRYNGQYPHIVRDWRHLLTSWHQEGAVDYGLDQNKFGRCQVDVDQHNPQFPTTGNCIQGGRVGYGVKSVSRDFLLSSDHALGGGGDGARGAILNPPTF